MLYQLSLVCFYQNNRGEIRTKWAPLCLSCFTLFIMRLIGRLISIKWDRDMLSLDIVSLDIVFSTGDLDVRSEFIAIQCDILHLTTECNFPITIIHIHFSGMVNRHTTENRKSSYILHGFVTLLDFAGGMASSPQQATVHLCGIFCLPWHRRSGTSDHGF
jgi:hypothetical protein